MEEGQGVYAAEQVRRLDQHAQTLPGLSGVALMRRAAQACWQHLQSLPVDARAPIHVFCGPGNCGGDGYLVARSAALARRLVHVWQVGETSTTGDAVFAREDWLAAGGEIRPWQGASLPAGQASAVIVDAIFGIGLKRPLEGVALGAVQAINAAAARGVRVVAVDVPSGLNADTGECMGAAVHAGSTVTFIARKTGFYLRDGPDHVGEVIFDSLGVSASLLPDEMPVMQRLLASELAVALPPRRPSAHKGVHGHVLVIGGDEGMAGAALLATRAALRTGAGRVSLATHPAHAAALVAAQPEAMVLGVTAPAVLKEKFEQTEVIAIGPGLGQRDWGRALFEAALRHQKPCVIDADALNLLAAAPQVLRKAVITPHPGEAARLLGITTAQVQADRLAAVRALSSRYGAVAVLKGAGSLVAGDGLWLCDAGNPGMAVGGMGDVLTGIIAALMGQGLTASDAARHGVLIHAMAGDRAAAAGQRGLLPSDVIAELRQGVNPRD